MIALRPRKLGAYNRPVPSMSIATPSRESTSARANAMYSMRIGPPTQLPAYIRYVHAVEVFASTRSPWLNTGPLPANMFRTVRSTISPSSAIQRRCQLPQPNSTTTTATPIHRLTRTVVSYGNGRPTRLATGRRRIAPALRASSWASAEGNRGSNCRDPRQRQQLQHPVTQRDLLRLPGQPAVDVHRVAQDRDGERNHRHRKPARRAVVTLEGPQPVAHHHRGGRQRPDEAQIGARVAFQRLADRRAGALGQLQLGVALAGRHEQRPERHD